MNPSEFACWYRWSSIAKGKLTPLAGNVVILISKPATGQLSRKELEEIRRLLAVRQALDE